MNSFFIQKKIINKKKVSKNGFGYRTRRKRKENRCTAFQYTFSTMLRSTSAEASIFNQIDLFIYCFYTPTTARMQQVCKYDGEKSRTKNSIVLKNSKKAASKKEYKNPNFRSKKNLSPYLSKYLSNNVYMYSTFLMLFQSRLCTEYDTMFQRFSMTDDSWCCCIWLLH